MPTSVRQTRENWKPTFGESSAPIVRANYGLELQQVFGDVERAVDVPLGRDSSFDLTPRGRPGGFFTMTARVRAGSGPTTASGFLARISSRSSRSSRSSALLPLTPGRRLFGSFERSRHARGARHDPRRTTGAGRRDLDTAGRRRSAPTRWRMKTSWNTRLTTSRQLS
jgi:hypothetical protein